MDFEYMDNELSVIGFRNVVKRWLKIERCKLKARYMAGKKDCPINIELVHWEKLKFYWSNITNKVKNMGNLGQLGKVRKEAKLVLINQPYLSFFKVKLLLSLFLAIVL
jgi:hypothetical protein